MLTNTKATMTVQQPWVPLSGVYLDTSAVMALTDHHRWWVRIAAFTSVFTVLELLDGVTESERSYRRRQAAIRRILDSGIHIVADMPQTSLTRAYPLLLPYYQWRHSDADVILRLGRALVAMDNMEDFQRVQQSDQQWQAVRTSWHELSLRTMSDSQTDQSKMWSLFEHATAAELQLYGIDPAIEPADRFTAFIRSPINVAVSRYVLLLVILASLQRPDDHDLGAKIDASWNGQGMPYFRVMALDHLDRVFHRQSAGRNDAYDRDHFAYMEPGAILATNDKRMASLGSAAGLTVTNCADLVAAARGHGIDAA